MVKRLEHATSARFFGAWQRPVTELVQYVDAGRHDRSRPRRTL